MRKTMDFGELRRASWHAAMLTIFGVVVVTLSVGYGVMRLHYLEKTAKVEHKQSASLNLQLEERRAEIDRLSQRVIEPKIFSLAPAVRSELQLASVVPDARADDLGQTNFAGEPVYRFSAWVDAASAVLAEIAEVNFLFDQKVFSSSERITRFQVSYLGWDCPDKVRVVVTLKNGKKSESEFDMCKAVGFTRYNFDTETPLATKQRKVRHSSGPQ